MNKAKLVFVLVAGLVSSANHASANAGGPASSGGGVVKPVAIVQPAPAPVRAIASVKK